MQQLHSHIFPDIKIFDKIIECTKIANIITIERTAIFGVQHLLETTGSLFEAIIDVGFNPKNIYLIGKAYSTNLDVFNKIKKLGINTQLNTMPNKRGHYSSFLQDDVNELWNRFCLDNIGSDKIDYVIVLDDGGTALRTIPMEVINRWKTIGIEQTTSGLRQNYKIQIPVIEVASSASKKIIEPHIIAEAILYKTKDLEGYLNNKCVGVIGLGSIGGELAKQLVSRGYNINVYDKCINVLNGFRYGNKIYNEEKFFTDSDFVYGCTGEDVCINTKWLNNKQGNLTLASCSSADIEFKSLLRLSNMTNKAEPIDPLKDYEYIRQDNRLKITILRGGFPINFDQSKESVPANDIQLTRGLLFAAVLQGALLLAANHNINIKRIMLDPHYQKIITEQWFKLNTARISQYSYDVMDIFENLNAIINKSK